MNIMITRRPIGEAPDWVRDAWIGLSLPTAFEKKRAWRSVGVLSGPHNALLQLWALATGKGTVIAGYAVNAKTAVDLLAVAQPNAAEWWRTNTPQLLNGRRYFLFDVDACEADE